MSFPLSNTNEDLAAQAFSRQSIRFDEIYSSDRIIQYKRKRVRDHVLSHLRPGSSILEINSGTGEDAIFFAELGYQVHATDISAEMQEVLRKKIVSLKEKISTEIRSFTDLDALQNKGPYDMVFSNFGGLNCTGELKKVLLSIAPLLKPGGKITLVIISNFCLWEVLLVFKGKFRTALRRFFNKTGRKAHVEGTFFNCWYYSPTFVKMTLKDSFLPLQTEGLCTFVPPSYLEGFAEKYPALFRLLIKAENKLKGLWPWKAIGDYFIITLEKK